MLCLKCQGLSGSAARDFDKITVLGPEIRAVDGVHFNRDKMFVLMYDVNHPGAETWPVVVSNMLFLENVL